MLNICKLIGCLILNLLFVVALTLGILVLYVAGVFFILPQCVIAAVYSNKCLLRRRHESSTERGFSTLKILRNLSRVVMSLYILVVKSLICCRICITPGMFSAARRQESFHEIMSALFSKWGYRGVESSVIGD